MSSKSDLKLEWFPTEILCLIFCLCDAEALARLSQTCRRFNEIIREDSLWKHAAQSALIANFGSKSVNARCLIFRGMQENCRLSHNWSIGKYEEIVYRFGSPRQKTRFMPWLWLESKKLWLSKGPLIEAYNRCKTDPHLASKPSVCLRGADEDMSRFLIKNGLIVSGGRNGGLYGWNCASKAQLFMMPRSHSSDVYDVDICEDLIFSASKDTTVKIWRIPVNSNAAISTVNIGDRVLCVSASSVAGRWCCGSSGVDMNPLHVFDINVGVQVASLVSKENNQRSGAGLLDVAWDSPHQILSCGYDASLKLWDLRVESCVQNWEDPHDTTLYCLSSDSKYAVLCGASRHGRVQLWDKRHKRALQMYFAKSWHSSPVYSLAFDHSSLYIALDMSLNCLDFSTKHAAPRNFSQHI